MSDLKAYYTFADEDYENDRMRQRILLKRMSHVQHDYFSSFNQSDHCFLGFIRFPSELCNLQTAFIIQSE